MFAVGPAKVVRPKISKKAAVQAQCRIGEVDGVLSWRNVCKRMRFKLDNACKRRQSVTYYRGEDV
jgi:hypothetical protein